MKFIKEHIKEEKQVSQPNRRDKGIYRIDEYNQHAYLSFHKIFICSMSHYDARNKRMLLLEYIWSTPWEKLLLPYANNKDTDQHAHMFAVYIAYFLYLL